MRLSGTGPRGPAGRTFIPGSVCLSPLTLLALIKGRIRVAEPDGDAALDLLAVPVRPGPCQRVDQGGLAVIDMTHEPILTPGMSASRKSFQTSLSKYIVTLLIRDQ